MLAYLILIFPIFFTKNLHKNKAHSATLYVVSVKLFFCLHLWGYNYLLVIIYKQDT